MFALPNPGVAESATATVVVAYGPVAACRLATVGAGPRWYGFAVWAPAPAGVASPISSARVARTHFKHMLLSPAAWVFTDAAPSDGGWGPYASAGGTATHLGGVAFR